MGPDNVPTVLLGQVSDAEKYFPRTAFLDQEEAECLVTLLGIKRQCEALHLHRTF